MICKIGHEIKTETGFKVFEVGKDYPADEIGDRGGYFEAAKPAPAKKEKIKEEVTSDDAAGR